MWPILDSHAILPSKSIPFRLRYQVTIMKALNLKQLSTEQNGMVNAMLSDLEGKLAGVPAGSPFGGQFVAHGKAVGKVDGFNSHFIARGKPDVEFNSHFIARGKNPPPAFGEHFIARGKPTSTN